MSPAAEQLIAEVMALHDMTREAAVLAYLFNIPYEDALRDLQERIEDGSILIETRH